VSDKLLQTIKETVTAPEVIAWLQHDRDKYKEALNELRCSVIAALILLPQGNGGKVLLEHSVRAANDLLNYAEDNAPAHLAGETTGDE